MSACYTYEKTLKLKPAPNDCALSGITWKYPLSDGLRIAILPVKIKLFPVLPLLLPSLSTCGSSFYYFILFFCIHTIFYSLYSLLPSCLISCSSLFSLLFSFFLIYSFSLVVIHTISLPSSPVTQCQFTYPILLHICSLVILHLLLFVHRTVMDISHHLPLHKGLQEMS